MGLKEKLESYGITPQKIPLAMGSIIVMDFTYTAALVGLCYKANPTKFILNTLPFKGPKAKFAAITANPKNWRFLSFIPAEKRGIASVAVCEMLLLKSILRPLAWPAMLWVSYTLVRD